MLNCLLSWKNWPWLLLKHWLVRSSLTGWGNCSLIGRCQQTSFITCCLDDKRWHPSVSGQGWCQITVCALNFQLTYSKFIFLLGSLCNRTIWVTASLLGIPPPTGQQFLSECFSYLLWNRQLLLDVERCASCVEFGASFQQWTYAEKLYVGLLDVIGLTPSWNKGDYYCIFTTWSLFLPF